MTVKSTIYRQCGLVQDLGHGVEVHQVSFIPARYAKKNHIIKLKQANGDWEEGWKAVEVGVGVDKDHLPNTRKQIKAHRKRTGDSLPPNRVSHKVH